MMRDRAFHHPIRRPRPHPVASARRQAPRVGALAALLLVAACSSTTDPDGARGEVATDRRADGGTAGGTGAASGAVSPMQCDGTLGAVTVEEVNVPQGATCVLAGTRVEGNVRVRRDATLQTSGAVVDGDIQAEDARRVETRAGTRVVGNVQVKRRAVADLAATVVDGDVQVEEAGASLIAGNVDVGGNLQMTKAEGAAIGDVRVDGDIQLVENRRALAVADSRVRGNVQVFKNTGGVRLDRNTVAQALQCKENAPPPTGGGNVAGEKEEQCRAL